MDEIEVEEELLAELEDKSMKPEEVLAIVKADYEAAKEAKKEINEKIAEWKKLYEGAPLGNEVEGRSQYVAKESQKAVNWWIPNAMRPFMSSDKIVDFAPRTADDISKANSQNTLLNYQFNNDFPKYQFLHTSLLMLSVEGTVVSRIGWIHEDETEVIPFEGFTQQQLIELQSKGAQIEIEETAQVQRDPLIDPMMGYDTIYKGTATITTTTVSRPDAEVIKNEDFFIIGETIEDSDCCIQRIDTNRSELRKQDKKYNPSGIYENVDDIVSKGKDDKEATLGQARADKLDEYGVDDNYKTSAKSREEITIYEYYGNIDMNGDGIAEPIVCVWSGNTILRLAPNPFPDEKPPFVGCPYSPVAFSFFGNGLPYFLEDVTKVNTAFTRTILDLAANSTNGMKHVQKGSLDALNMRRLKEAKIGTVVEWNDLGGYQADAQNTVNTAYLNYIEHFTSIGENESGITRYSQGLDAQSLNKTATGITAIMNQSQMRTWETVTRFAEQYLKPLFRKWIAYNQAFLDMNIALRVAGNRYETVSPDDIKGNFDLTINVGIAGSEESKSQKIVQMLQMVQPLVQTGVVPPTHISKLIAELEELWGFKDLAEELNTMIEQAEMQQQQMQAQQGIQQQGQPQQIPQ